ncbi:MAG: guanylate kinase [Gammaproteobacteria bacterium]|nr:guanylate kinase [Gammaproteobacteria bacterium]
MSQGNLFVVSAPSGAGKTSLVRALLEAMPGVILSISATTRPARPGEQDGRDYFFVDREDFQQRRAQDAFLEHAEVFGNFYGTPRDWVEERLAEGLDVVLEIDWQGARQVRERMPAVSGIFVLPPSVAALAERLAGRGQDDEEVIARRMAAAREEIRHYDEFDYIVVNDDFDVALEDIKAIIRAARLGTSSQRVRQRPLLQDLLALPAANE